MNIEMVIQPYAEPLTVTEMKNHLKQDSDITTDDDLISAQMVAARNLVETLTGANVPRYRVLMATTFDVRMDEFPYCDFIHLPCVPLISVTSITYIDSNGVSQTLSTSLYTVDYPQSRIHLAYGEDWPATRDQVNAVTVRFVAGQAASFTAATSDVCTVSGRTFTNGDRVRVRNSGGALPTGLSAETDYFVIESSTNTFKLSTTSGGSAVDITGTGSGTHYITQDMASFETARAAIKLQVGSLYFDRGDGGGSVDYAQQAIHALAASIHG